MQIMTLEELRQQREQALKGSALAIREHHQAYLALKKMVGRINSGPLDVADYYATAMRLAALLSQLSTGAACTIFHYFAECIDPDRKGDVRCFRMECFELASQIQQLDRWRTCRHRLRSVK
jgi:hypothetical protein